MRFYDFHVHSTFSEGQSSLEDLASTAKKLGFSGFCFSAYYRGGDQLKRLKEEIEKVKRKIPIEIFLGFEARTVKELDILADRRKRFDILLARGGDLKMNREAVETSEVDMLTHPEHERLDSGLNQVLVKLAAKNDVAIEFNFREILVSNKKTRSRILSNMHQNLILAKKFRAPIIVCSGAVSHWEMRDPFTLISFLEDLGLELNFAKKSVSSVPENILKNVKRKGSEKWVAEGVEIV